MTANQPSASNATRARVILAGICALVVTVGLARFAYTPMLPVMRDGAGPVSYTHLTLPTKRIV